MKQNEAIVKKEKTTSIPEYSIDEILESKLLGVPSECVIAALKPTGKRTFTLNAASACVQAFLKKEVI